MLAWMKTSSCKESGVGKRTTVNILGPLFACFSVETVVSTLSAVGALLVVVESSSVCG